MIKCRYLVINCSVISLHLLKEVKLYLDLRQNVRILPLFAVFLRNVKLSIKKSLKEPYTVENMCNSNRSCS